MEYSITVKGTADEVGITAEAVSTFDAISEFLEEGKKKLNYPDGKSHDWIGGYHQAMKDLETLLEG